MCATKALLFKADLIGLAADFATAAFFTAFLAGAFFTAFFAFTARAFFVAISDSNEVNEKGETSKF
jgi:hypothetical protein